MAKRAVIELLVVDLPARLRGTVPPLGVVPAGHELVSESERTRVAREASRATILLSKATRAQSGLVERVARAAPGKRLRMPTAAPLERFLEATGALDRKSAAALTDDELATMWRKAASTSTGTRARRPRG